MCTDNLYTSVSLTRSLPKKKTRLVGTLRKDRKLNPEEATGIHFKKGGIVGKDSNTGGLINTWKDNRNVLMLLTTKPTG